jgi:hypothetical protein
MRCAGSPRLTAGIKSRGSQNAAEGTFAHEIAAVALKGVQPPERWLGKRRIIDDEFEVMCTEEMIAAVKTYVDDIDDEMLPMDDHWVEVDLTKALQKLHPDLGGTADFVRYRPSKKHLRVRDFKYGAGVLVDVEENEQAMIYALGALLTIGKPCDTVTATIDQPRAEHPDGRSRDYTFDATRLLDFAAELVEAAIATEQPNAPLIPGDKQCRWCPAKPTCPALEAKQTLVMAEQFSLPALTGPKLAEALTIIPAVKARIKALEEMAYTRAVQGETIPGFKLVDKRPTRQWRDEGALINWAKANAVDPYEQKVLSPAQMEKKLAETAPRGKKKEAGAAIAPFVEKVSSGTALVPETDDRNPVKLISAEDFSVAQ